MLECARRLGWALNTVKRYARAHKVEELLRPPRYGPSLVDAHRGLTLPYSNGPTEGVNTKIKLLKRQTYGKASFALLRKRILLA